VLATGARHRWSPAETRAGPIVLRKNRVATEIAATGATGSSSAGAGTGSWPVEIDENDVAGNAGDGVRRDRSGHQLVTTSGGAATSTTAAASSRSVTGNSTRAATGSTA